MCRIFQCGNTPEELKNCADYQDLRDYLVSYQKAKEHQRWEEFRLKIGPRLLKLWGMIMVDCRRNGFMAPVADEMIHWSQILANSGGMLEDLCTMCDRPCHIRSMLETGEYKRRKQADINFQEPLKCWQS